MGERGRGSERGSELEKEGETEQEGVREGERGSGREKEREGERGGTLLCVSSALYRCLCDTRRPRREDDEVMEM